MRSGHSKREKWGGRVPPSPNPQGAVLTEPNQELAVNRWSHRKESGRKQNILLCLWYRRNYVWQTLSILNATFAGSVRLERILLGRDSSQKTVSFPNLLVGNEAHLFQAGWLNYSKRQTSHELNNAKTHFPSITLQNHKYQVVLFSTFTDFFWTENGNIMGFLWFQDSFPITMFFDQNIRACAQS